MAGRKKRIGEGQNSGFYSPGGIVKFCDKTGTLETAGESETANTVQKRTKSGNREKAEWEKRPPKQTRGRKEV